MSEADSLQPPCREETKENSTELDGSYGEILKSSSIIGGAQVINMSIGLVRTKLVAVLIGPEGIGLLGIYQSITVIATTLSGLGVQTSGVREVAKQFAEGDHEAITRTIYTLRRLSWIMGLVGMFFMVIMSDMISRKSLGTREHAWAICLLGVAVLLTNISSGQSAIIQGTRRIADLARISILSAVASTGLAIAIYSWIGINGIAPALVCIAAVSLVLSSFYSHRIQLKGRYPTWIESLEQSKVLVKLGAAMVISAVLTGLTNWGIQILVTQYHGLSGAGVYAAAFSLSGLFVHFVLTAMGSDFYPRLTSCSHDHNTMVRMINEQTEVGLLLTIPGLLGTLALAPTVVSVFYTTEFSEAADLLKWFLLGCVGRVLSWPMGFSLLAKSSGRTFVVTECIFNLLHILLVWAGLNRIGLTGVGVAFAVIYLLYTLLMLFVTYNTIGFYWSRSVVCLVAWSSIVTIACFLVSFAFHWPISTPVTLGVSLCCGLVCFRHLAIKVGWRYRMR